MTIGAHVQKHAVKYTLGGAALAASISLVSAWEGYYGHVYKDSVGVSTICYGATAADGVDLTRIYTKAECQRMLGRDLPKYDAQIQHCISDKVYTALPPNRHAALVSITYNIGGGAFCKSSIVKDLNAGRVQQACDDFLKYNRAGGRVLQGLVNRRRAERKLCLSSA